MEENLDDLKKQINEIENLFGDLPEDEKISQDEYDSILSEFGLDLGQLSADMDAFQPTMPVQFSKSNNDSVSPQYAYPTDSGFDLYSTEEIIIESFGRTLVPTGLHFDIPDGYEIQVRSKSGLALKQGLMVLNSPGTVDQGYTGEIKVILFNTSKDTVTINKGQKVAQGVISPVVCGKWVNLVQVDNVEDKDRSDNGFGSTGI